MREMKPYAEIRYGWIVDYKDIPTIDPVLDPEDDEYDPFHTEPYKLTFSDFLVPLNAFDPDNTKYVFGIRCEWSTDAIPMYQHDFDSEDWEETEEWDWCSSEFEEFYPQFKKVEPKFFLVLTHY